MLFHVWETKRTSMHVTDTTATPNGHQMAVIMCDWSIHWRIYAVLGGDESIQVLIKRLHFTIFGWQLFLLIILLNHDIVKKTLSVTELMLRRFKKGVIIVQCIMYDFFLYEVSSLNVPPWEMYGLVVALVILFDACYIHSSYMCV